MFIVDTFDKFSRWDKEHCVHRFEANGVQYAIYQVELEWGLPVVGGGVDEDRKPEWYKMYETLEEAMGYAAQVRMLN